MFGNKEKKPIEEIRETPKSATQCFSNHWASIKSNQDTIEIHQDRISALERGLWG
jgi:hypothetical protein